MKSYQEHQEVKGEIVQYGMNEYRMRDTNGVIWETKEATCDGYVMRDYKVEDKEKECTCWNPDRDCPVHGAKKECICNPNDNEWFNPGCPYHKALATPSLSGGDDNKRFSEEYLNSPRNDILSTPYRPSIDPPEDSGPHDPIKPHQNNGMELGDNVKGLDRPEDSQSWEEMYDMEFGENSGRMTFLSEQSYYWNKAFYEKMLKFIKNTVFRAWNAQVNEEMERRVNEAWESGFKKGFDDCKGLVERGEHAHCCVVPKNEQIDRLATFLMENYPEAITDGGAGDVAIKLLQKSKLEE